MPKQKKGLMDGCLRAATLGTNDEESTELLCRRYDEAKEMEDKRSAERFLAIIKGRKRFPAIRRAFVMMRAKKREERREHYPPWLNSILNAFGEGQPPKKGTSSRNVWGVH